MTKPGQQKRIPRDFAAKLEAARARRTMHGECRIITALFCDVAGSTAMAEQLDPEEWGEKAAFLAMLWLKTYSQPRRTRSSEGSAPIWV